MTNPTSIVESIDQREGKMSETNFVPAPPNLWATMVCAKPGARVVTQPALVLGWEVGRVGRRPVFADGGSPVFDGDWYPPLALLPAPDGSGWVDVLGYARLPIAGLELDEIVALYGRFEARQDRDDDDADDEHPLASKESDDADEAASEARPNRQARLEVRADTDDIVGDDNDADADTDTEARPRVKMSHAWPSDDAGLGMGKSTHGALAKVIAALDPATSDYVPRLVKLFADLQKGDRRASELAKTKPPAGMYLLGQGCVVVAAREIGQPPAVLFNYRDLLFTTDVVAGLNQETPEAQS
jgi:hypothetical protein